MKDWQFDISLFNLTVCTNGDIRLQGGTKPGEGRVEICNNNQWGTVCYSWRRAVANVACRQLGFLPTGLFHMHVNFVYQWLSL